MTICGPLLGAVCFNPSLDLSGSDTHHHGRQLDTGTHSRMAWNRHVVLAESRMRRSSTLAQLELQFKEIKLTMVRSFMHHYRC